MERKGQMFINYWSKKESKPKATHFSSEQNHYQDNSNFHPQWYIATYFITYLYEIIQAQLVYVSKETI